MLPLLYSNTLLIIHSIYKTYVYYPNPSLPQLSLPRQTPVYASVLEGIIFIIETRTHMLIYGICLSQKFFEDR